MDPNQNIYKMAFYISLFFYVMNMYKDLNTLVILVPIFFNILLSNEIIGFMVLLKLTLMLIQHSLGFILLFMF